MAEDQERPNQPPKGGWTQRIRSFFSKGGGERSQLSSQPLSSQPQTEAPFDVPPLTPIKESTLEEIQDPDFGVKAYFMEAAHRGYPVTEKKVGEYTILQVITPLGWGRLHDDFPRTGGPESESEVSAVLLEGNVVGGKLVSRNKISDTWKSENEIIEVGILGEKVVHYTYGQSTQGSSVFDVFLGGHEQLIGQDRDPEDAFLRLVRFGKHFSRADVEIEYVYWPQGWWPMIPEAGEGRIFKFHFKPQTDRLGREIRIDRFDEIFAAISQDKQELPLPQEYEGRRYYLNKTPEGLLVFRRENSDDSSLGAEFPANITQAIPTDSLGQILKSDTDWLNLPRLLPIRFNQTLPPQK